MIATDLAAFAGRLADRAGEVIRPLFRTGLSADDKSGGGPFDPVTEADRAAEAAMRAMIRESFPAHGILGEEFGAERADAEHVWVLDPIDGTKSFICGLPLWGTLVGLGVRGRPAYGLLNQPVLAERFAGDGTASRYDGPSGSRTLRTRPCPGLAQAIVMTTHPGLMGGAERAAFSRVEARCRLSRYGGDCYAYAMLAAGHVDLVIEAGLKPYDIAPLIPIIEGAGGVITTWDGGDPSRGGAIVAAGDPRTHEAALRGLEG